MLNVYNVCILQGTDGVRYEMLERKFGRFSIIRDYHKQLLHIPKEQKSTFIRPRLLMMILLHGF